MGEGLCGSNVNTIRRKMQKLEICENDSPKDILMKNLRSLYLQDRNLEKLTKTKTTNGKFDLLTLANRKFVREAIDGVFNITCLTNDEWDKKPIEVNGLRNKVSQEGVELWARLVSTFSYKLLRMADSESDGWTVDENEISAAFHKLVVEDKIPVLLPLNMQDPIFTPR